MEGREKAAVTEGEGGDAHAGQYELLWSRLPKQARGAKGGRSPGTRPESIRSGGLGSAAAPVETPAPAGRECYSGASEWSKGKQNATSKSLQLLLLPHKKEMGLQQPPRDQRGLLLLPLSLLLLTGPLTLSSPFLLAAPRMTALYSMLGVVTTQTRGLIAPRRTGATHCRSWDVRRKENMMHWDDEADIEGKGIILSGIRQHQQDDWHHHRQHNGTLVMHFFPLLFAANESSREGRGMRRESPGGARGRGAR